MTPKPHYVFALIIGIASHGCDESQSPTPTADPTADLRADSNRDGEVRIDDDSDLEKLRWDERSGAVFLANLDDDGGRCTSNSLGSLRADCNDASDEVINGSTDMLDLAKLRVPPHPQPIDATAKIMVFPEVARTKVRLFRRVGSDYQVLRDAEALTRQTLEEGLELLLEGKDIVRDDKTWDGYIEVALVVESPARGVITDRVRMRVAPVLTYHHLLPAETIWVSGSISSAQRETHEGIARSAQAAGIAAPRDLNVADQWAQDFFEGGFMAMPGAGGSRHIMRVNYRSANLVQPPNEKAPLRPAGQVVFQMRDKDTGAIEQVDTRHLPQMDRLNSFGNFETIPPYTHEGQVFPFGRVLRGSTSAFYPDRSFSAMIDAQRQQPTVEIDTSWLYVAHVDEIVSFVPAPNERGWVMLVADPRGGKAILEGEKNAGHGDALLFRGKSWIDDTSDLPASAEVSISSVLADTRIMQASEEAAIEIDKQVATLARELGLGSDEIVPIPSLDMSYMGKSVAFVPAMVNGLLVAPKRFAAPEPHGPLIDGVDPFKAATERALRDVGVTVDWVEDWDGYHRYFGEVHCASNSTRAIPQQAWWESGR